MLHGRHITTVPLTQLSTVPLTAYNLTQVDAVPLTTVLTAAPAVDTVPAESGGIQPEPGCVLLAVTQSAALLTPFAALTHFAPARVSPHPRSTIAISEVLGFGRNSWPEWAGLPHLVLPDGPGKWVGVLTGEGGAGAQRAVLTGCCRGCTSWWGWGAARRPWRFNLLGEPGWEQGDGFSGGGSRVEVRREVRRGRFSREEASLVGQNTAVVFNRLQSQVEVVVTTPHIFQTTPAGELMFSGG